MRKLSYLIILLLAVIPLSTSAQKPGNRNGDIKIPDSNAGRIVSEFVTAFNSDDSGGIVQFTEKYLSGELSNSGLNVMTKEKYLKIFGSLKSQTRTLTPVDIRENGDAGYLGVIFMTDKPKILGIEFITNKAGDALSLLEMHSMNPPSPPYKWKEGKLSDDEIVSELRKRIKQEVDSDRFSGSVLIARGDKIIFEEAYGYANRSSGQLNKKDTRFHTASVGKMITAVAIAQLVEKGSLTFETRLSEIFDDYPDPSAAEKITIGMLLSHTAGIADPFEYGSRINSFLPETGTGIYPAVAFAPLTHEPGSYHRYSNGNYALLKTITEKVSGVKFQDYLMKNIFLPSGMQIADSAEYSRLPYALNYGYDISEDPLGINPKTPTRESAAAPFTEYNGYGNGYLCPRDIYNFLYALQSGKLISREMTDLITSGKTDVEPGAPVKYGYGFYDVSMWGVSFRGHSGGGGNSGIGAEAEMIQGKDYYIILLGNFDLEYVRPLTFSIIRFLGGQ